MKLFVLWFIFCVRDFNGTFSFSAIYYSKLESWKWNLKFLENSEEIFPNQTSNESVNKLFF